MRPMNVLIRLLLMIAALSTLPGPAKLSRKTSFKFRVLYREPCRPPDQPAQKKQKYADVLQTTDNPLASLKVTMDEYLIYKWASNQVCTFSQISKSRNPIPLRKYKAMQMNRLYLILDGDGVICIDSIISITVRSKQ